jgi:hypothetical protein
MTPDENGRYCAHCQKTVLDLTQLSDAQLYKRITEAQKHGAICGRITNAQLLRTIAAQQPALSTTVSFCSRVAAAFMLFQGFVASTIAQTNTKPIRTENHTSSAHRLPSPKPLVLKGSVVHLATQEPLAGVMVSVAGTPITTITSATGSFILHLPQSLQGQEIILQASHTALSGTAREGTAFTSPSILVSPSMLVQPVLIEQYTIPTEVHKPAIVKAYKMPLDWGGQTVVTGGLECAPSPKTNPNLFQRIKRLFTRKQQ